MNTTKKIKKVKKQMSDNRFEMVYKLPAYLQEALEFCDLGDAGYNSWFISLKELRNQAEALTLRYYNEEPELLTKKCKKKIERYLLKEVEN
jgi:hypothetical protein